MLRFSLGTKTLTSAKYFWRPGPSLAETLKGSIDDVELEKEVMGMDAPPKDGCYTFILPPITSHIHSTLGPARPFSIRERISARQRASSPISQMSRLRLEQVEGQHGALGCSA